MTDEKRSDEEWLAQIEREAQALSTTEEWLAQIEREAQALATTLRDASDAGVPHALVLPRLVLVFRQTFGEMPAGFQLPGVNL